MNSQEVAGFWNHHMSHAHSNYRELMCILLALKSFRTELVGKHVQILSDNVTDCAMTNKLRGASQDLSDLAQTLWTEAYE